MKKSLGSNRPNFKNRCNDGEKKKKKKEWMNLNPWVLMLF